MEELLCMKPAVWQIATKICSCLVNLYQSHGGSAFSAASAAYFYHALIPCSNGRARVIANNLCIQGSLPLEVVLNAREKNRGKGIQIRGGRVTHVSRKGCQNREHLGKRVSTSL